MNNFGEVCRATDNLLQISTDNIEQIRDVLRKIKKTRTTIIDPARATDQENLRECNSAAAIISAATTGLMAALYAREPRGATPMEHLAVCMNEAMNFMVEKDNVKIETVSEL